MTTRLPRPILDAPKTAHTYGGLERVWKKYRLKNLKAENGKIRKDTREVKEKRNQVKLLWFQSGGAFHFITAV